MAFSAWALGVTYSCIVDYNDVLLIFSICAFNFLNFKETSSLAFVISIGTCYLERHSRDVNI